MIKSMSIAEELVEARIQAAGDHPSNYDVDSMIFDLNNQNLNLDVDDISEYECENVVRMSIINGQRKQAIMQAHNFGLNFHDIDSTTKK